MDLNPFDADKWRAKLAEFDAVRVEFLNRLAALQKVRGPTPALEAERQKLIKDAGPIKASMDGLLSGLNAVRTWLRQFGSVFSSGGLNGMSALPLIGIGVSLTGLALVVNAASSFIERVKKWDTLRIQIQEAAKAGATGEQISKIGASSPGSSAKLFGFDVRWLLAIGALVIAGPYVVKGLEKYRVIK